METKRLFDLLSQAAHQVRAAAKAYWQRQASVIEIDRLGSQQAANLAGDLGVSPEELRTLAGKDKNAADLLVRRMATIGLDPNRVDPWVMRDLQRCCSLCRDKGLCIHELEDQPREPTWPAYCPNEQTLDALNDQAGDRTSPCRHPAMAARENSKH